MSCMSGSSNLNSFRDRGQVAIQLVSCWVFVVCFYFTVKFPHVLLVTLFCHSNFLFVIFFLKNIYLAIWPFFIFRLPKPWHFIEVTVDQSSRKKKTKKKQKKYWQDLQPSQDTSTSTTTTFIPFIIAYCIQNHPPSHLFSLNTHKPTNSSTENTPPCYHNLSLVPNVFLLHLHPPTYSASSQPTIPFVYSFATQPRQGIIPPSLSALGAPPSPQSHHLVNRYRHASNDPDCKRTQNSDEKVGGSHVPHLTRGKYPYDDFARAFSFGFLPIFLFFFFCYGVVVGRCFDDDNGNVNEMAMILYWWWHRSKYLFNAFRNHK